MTITGRTLVGAGVILMLFAGFQVWGTSIREARAQATLRTDLEDRFERARIRIDDLLPAAETSRSADTSSGEETDAQLRVDDGDAAESVVDDGDGDRSPLTDLDPEVLALLFPEDGAAVARIEIPALDVDKVVVRGTQVADLRTGPGLYRSTALPGNSGNAAIAGHRTTYGAPFNRIDELSPGDEIAVTTIQGRFTYRVLDPEAAFGDHGDDIAVFGDGHVIVRPDDTWVLDDFGDNRLTLTACNPKYSARQRIIVAAELISAPVELPEPIAELVEVMEAGELAGEVSAVVDARNLSDPAAEPESDLATGATEFDLSRIGGRADLDEGLNGERDAIPAAIGWLTVAIACWLVASRLARHQLGWRRRLVPYAVALIPVLPALWMCFDAADRALPAY